MPRDLSISKNKILRLNAGTKKTLSLRKKVAPKESDFFGHAF
ncbi:hypothetical protein CHCC20335_2194 [Bacillus paralicheniformis]|nr:hypothetical protein CHCC20335_2194 [Bacillus paralicheniformis]